MPQCSVTKPTSLYNPSACCPLPWPYPKPESRPCLVPGDLRIQHTVTASLHLSFGEDLQIDWDGRGRLLLKVGALLAAGPRTKPLLCSDGRARGWEGNSFLSLLALSPQSEEQTSLVCERLVIAVWMPLVHPRSSWVLGSGPLRVSSLGGLPAGLRWGRWWAAGLLLRLLTATRVVIRGCSLGCLLWDSQQRPGSCTHYL